MYHVSTEEFKETHHKEQFNMQRKIMYFSDQLLKNKQ